MAQSKIVVRPDCEGVLSAQSGKTKLILVILANLYKEKAFSGSIAAYVRGCVDLL